MLFGREQFTVKTELGGEVIDKLYAKELVPTPIGEFEKLPEDEKKLRKPYPFNQRTYEAAPGIICDQDVAVPMRDGVVLYADIFRPADSAAKVPVILAWSNYGKRPNEYRPTSSRPTPRASPKGPFPTWRNSKLPTQSSGCPTAMPSQTWTSAESVTRAGTMSSSASRTPKTATTSSNGAPSSPGATGR